MSRAIWSGAISFGLVTIPVEIHPAEQPRELAFRLLDRRTMSPIRQERVNAETGEPVPWEDVVKGYEVSPGNWVVVTEEDLTAANVKATRTIDIIGMVRAAEVPLRYLDRPYYLTPASSAARKAYAILRDTLAGSGFVGLANVVIRTRQHAALVLPEGEALVLELIRYPYELRATDDLDLPSGDLASLGVTPKELELAGQLVAALAAPFDPSVLKDTYHDDLLALIERKAVTGEVARVSETPASEPGEVVDIMDLLKRSLAEKKAKGA